MRLSRLEGNVIGEIVRVRGEGTLAQRLAVMGFLPGTLVRVVQVAPLGDPIEVELNGWRLSLRRRDAAVVQVRPASPAPESDS